MERLDLHGIKHSEVDRLVENFVFEQYPDEAVIVTGNSTKMKELVKNVLDRSDIDYIEGDFVNRGYITVNTSLI